MGRDPKAVKKETWLMLLTGLSGLGERDYEVELQPLEDGKIRLVISFDAAMQWQAARLFMALVDSNYGPFEVEKVYGHIEVRFMWPAWIECLYMGVEA
jgi:hypothetical protein